MPATPIPPVRCRRSTRRFSGRPSAKPPPTTTASSIAISPVGRWRQAAAMAPDAEAGKSSIKRADPFAPLTSELFVVGGSWGATLALAYAQAHADRVFALVLRATFLGTVAEIETAFTDVLARFYPDLSDDFRSVLPLAERPRPLDAYWRRILDPDPAVHGPVARAWADTERILSEHVSNRARLDMASLNSDRALPATPFMEAHYFANDCFMKPNQLLNEAGKLAGIPGVIVQGRYDLLCPPSTSHALGAVWREAEIRFVEGAGHTLYDPGVRDAVMKAI